MSVTIRKNSAGYIARSTNGVTITAGTMREVLTLCRAQGLRPILEVTL